MSATHEIGNVNNFSNDAVRDAGYSLLVESKADVEIADWSPQECISLFALPCKMRASS